ncbi:hypothetical protein EZV61_09330 [Corallincola luteus]|uniref:VCBS repeat-containing protein n=1 Tax=Corallincola luteus TaxID=1775177 RepID=A0ABY2ALX3_9GAMM|nr:hypothetical protein [Corallincola luteus]TCI03731.1 hypothetical protein EZV61_09330 [Corallincola luteus]
MTALTLDRLQTQSSHFASREQSREIVRRGEGLPASNRNTAPRTAAQPSAVQAGLATAEADLAQQQAQRLAASANLNSASSLANFSLRSPEASDAVPDLDALPLTPELRVAVQMMEALAGRKFELFALDHLPQQSAAASGFTYSAQAQLSVEMTAPVDDTPVLVIERVSEQERMSFSASGQVTLANGDIQVFSVSLMMARDQQQVNLSATTAGALKDPLVLNLGGNGVSLSEQKHEIDLDADGETESVAMLGKQSFYLVLDSNGNGEVDDGRELFGALSGNGFADLAAFDEDGNGFVDQGDSVFNQLRLWQPQTEQWLSLADVDVMALYVGSESTPFMLKDSDMSLQGAVRSTGFFLRNEGPAGTLQQVDLVV